MIDRINYKILYVAISFDTHLNHLNPLFNNINPLKFLI